MKRSDFFLRLTTAVLFLAVVCYIGSYVYKSLGTGFETVTAITVTVDETGSVTGYVVREEAILPGGGNGFSPLARDGEKVAAGQVVAIGFENSGALYRAGELRSIKLKIEQLEAVAAAGAAQGAVLASESVMALSKILNDGRINGLDAALIRVESYVLTGVNALTAEDLPALREQLRALEAQSAGDASVRAPTSGVYSQVVDGYEGVRPEMLSGLTPGGLSDLFKPASGTNGSASTSAGKLITGIRWYYTVAVESDDTRRLSAGKEVEVQFKGEYQGTVAMKVDSVGRIEDGKCVVVLSCASALAEVTGVRQIEAEIVFDTFTGIRVPKEAIHLGDDGKTYVYLQTGAQAERAEVTILAEFGDSYVAVNAGSKPLLRDGAKIITKANNLDDGKVVIG